MKMNNKGFIPQIRSRHPSHSILRGTFPRMNVRSVIRFGSETEINDGKKRIEINSVEGVISNKSFIDCRKEFDYEIPTYEVMIKEMIDLIKNNKEFYAQYKLD